MQSTATYLEEIVVEAIRRDYCFDAQKIAPGRVRKKIPVTSGQLEYELEHLRRKLWHRDRQLHRQLEKVVCPEVHPFSSCETGSWETGK